jgi:hypothetical protein
MTQAGKTFRIFVSSTFSDLKAERNALQERVFPRLRALAAAHGCRFQAIDLRWGVSNEASLDQQAMNICLGEIERCQKTTPRPNFVVLLGERYGWCPPSSQVPAGEFDECLRVVHNAEDSALLKEWYRLNGNAVPPEWRLQPRERGSQYENYDNWQPVESRLHAILAAAAAKLNLTDEQQLPYIASATEQEIAAGALRVKGAPEHVHCFFRSISGLPRQFSLAARDFLDLDESTQTVDEEAYGKQNHLKERLAAYVPGNVHIYQAQWTGDGITTDHIDPLCEDVFTSLARIILDEIEHPHEIVSAEEGVVHIRPDEALDDEGLAHRQFAEERLRFFVGRSEMLAKIAGYLKDSQRRALAIVGAGGTGKSALMARAIQQTQGAHPKAEIVYRFIGATPGSSDGRSLLDSLCREISRRYGADEATIPMDYRDLVPELGKRMKLATADQPLVLFLDSLDQLSTSQDARNLLWLPNELPEHVSVIASTRPDDTLDALRAKQAREEELTGLSRGEGDDLLSQWLASVHRALQPAQRQEVLDKFEQSQGNPLYLRLAFEEARLWTSDSGQPPEQLAPGVSGIIKNNMIDRLEKEGKHGEVLVSRALGYLAASRYGLAEDELVDLLSRDLQVYGWFLESSYHVPADLLQWAVQYRRSHSTRLVKADGQSRMDEERAALDWLKEMRIQPKELEDFLTEILPKVDGPRLPVVLWSRLSFDLQPYLAERLVDGSPLLTFYHGELGDVSAQVFLAQGQERPYHARLADYFRFKADPQADKSWTGNYPHGLSELPYHLTRATRYEQVYQTLTDFKFLEHKAAQVGVLERKDEKGNLVKTYTGVLQLQDDLQRALSAMPGEGGAESTGGRPPLIVTAVDSGVGLTVYCPVCNKTSPLDRNMLDTGITCPQQGCNTPLKINPFVIHRS